MAPIIEPLKDFDDSCLLTYIYKGDEGKDESIVSYFSMPKAEN